MEDPNVESQAELARLLRQLRRREGRRRGASELTYRQLAAKTGWSRATIGDYLSGKTLPPTDRFDALARLLGATAAELGQLATLRDRVEEARRRATPGSPPRRSTVDGPGPPRQLPKPVWHLAGRRAELATLTRLAGTVAEGATTAVVLTIGGTAGIGKTALAVFWAHQVADQFPDGQLYVNLRGFTPAGGPLPPQRVVRGFLEALGVAPERIPLELDGQTALYRSLLSGRRMLVLLDNAYDADQVRPLLPASAGSLVVVTSRSRLTGLIACEDARPLTVDVLADGEARDLLAARLGAERLLAEPQAVERIVRSCAGLPLALSIVAARVAEPVEGGLATLARELGDARTGLDGLDAEDPAADIRAVFSWSYRALGLPAARLFRLLGLYPGPDVAAPGAASLLGEPVEVAQRLLTELCHAHLVAEQSPGRYGLHDLLRVYARELVEAVETEAGRTAARQRLLDYHVHSAYGAAMAIHPHRYPIAVPAPDPAVAPEVFGHHDAAEAWLRSEHAGLLAALDTAVEAGLDRHAWQLAWALSGFHQRGGHWSEWVATQQTAVQAAQRARDRLGQAHSHRSLGRAYARLGRYAEAEAHLRQALHLYEGDGAAADTQLNLAWLFARQGDHAGAIGFAESALDRHRDREDVAGQARALNNLSCYRAELGDLDRARANCESAIGLHQRIGDVHGQAHAWDTLGLLHQRHGDLPDATECYRRAIDLFRSVGDRYGQAVVLDHLGDAHRAAGDVLGARTAWRQARDTLTELNHPHAREVHGKLLNA